MNKKKILMVSGILESDGKKGFTQPFVDRQIESLRDLGLDIISFSIRGWESKINYLKAIFRINKMLSKDKDIALIHAHYSYSGIVSSFQKRVPVVVSLMGDDVYGTSKKNGKPSFLSTINIYLIKLFMKRWSAIIVKSNKMAHYIIHKNLSVVPNGVDINKFSPIDKNIARKELGWKEDDNYVLFGGNPANMRKNFILAQKTIDLLIKEGLNINLVSLTNIPHVKIPLFLNASDCMLFTSFTEGSPNIVKEAIACNLPVVSVNVGDVEERLANLPNCYVTDYNPVLLAGFVKRVLNNKIKYNLRDSLKNLALNEVAKTILNIYQQVLNDDKETFGIDKKENPLHSSIKI